MYKQVFRDHIRIFYFGLLGIAILFLVAFLASFLGAFGGTPSYEAYGDAELTDENFTLPDVPLMKIWVWEKGEAEGRTLVSLDARTPVNSGPPVMWSEGIRRTYGLAAQEEATADNQAFASVLPFSQNGLTISVQAEGEITARWVHATDCDCGYSHTWWYSPDRDVTGALDMMNASRSSDAKAKETNSLCLLWRGQGGSCIDTVSGESNVDNVRHTVTPLSDVIGKSEDGLNDTVTQDSMVFYIFLECRNLLGRLTATATLKVTMVGAWEGAEQLYLAEAALVPITEEHDYRWLAYAIQRPTWTVELISYREP